MISICTPTYNRAHTLTRLYNSLKLQSNNNFEWIVIDDGSIDETKQLLDSFIKENYIDIKYIYQNNHGKHVALNKGQDVASKELFLCLDSDDWLKNNAVQEILNNYSCIKHDNKICGMIFLDELQDGSIIGSELPENKIENWIDLVYEKGMNGDKCYIFKTDIIKKYPFKIFENNNHMPPTYQHYLISESYDFYCINKAIKIVEYMEDGISQNIVKKYFSAPDNYTYYRRRIHHLIPNKKDKLRNAMHYNITKIMSVEHESLNVRSKKQRFDNLLVFPLSFMAYIYLKIKKKW